MNQIRRKFRLSILIVAIFSTILTGLVSIFLGRKIIEKEANKVLLLTAIANANIFEKELSNLQLHQQSLESFILSYDDTLSPQNIIKNQKIIANNVRYYCRHSHPFSLWVVFNPDYLGFPLVISMYDSTGNGKYVFEPNYDIRDLNPVGTETKWWRDAINYGEVWTAPYYWKPWAKYIISYSKALYNKRIPFAVMGSDFNFDSLRNQIKNVKIYKSGYVWMMDSSFNIISHPVLEGQNLKNLKISKNVLTSLSNKKYQKGNIIYQFENAKKNMAYQRLSNGWYVCVSAPYNEIFEGSQIIFRIIGLIVLLTIIAGVLISYRIAQTITKPINRFVESFVKGATGDLSIRVPETSKDEMRLLEFHFNHFLEKTQRMVDELYTAQKSLLEAKNAAEEANNLKTAFLANMSHEIRTPLNAVIGFTSLLKILNISESERNRYIDHVIHSSYGLLALVESLVEYSTLEVGRLEINPSVFRIDQFLRIFFENFMLNNESRIPKTLTIKYKENEGCKQSTLFSDPIRITRILYHLLDNAVKYSENGSVELGFKQCNNEEIILYVKDAGIGIRKEFEKKIWESFYKGDTSEINFHIGAGLGLSICQKLTNLLGGKIWFESEYGHGSCFYLSLPILVPPSDHIEISSKYQYPEILIIDENIDSFREIQRTVVSFGLKVLWARNGVEALGLITMEPTVKLVICNLLSNSIEGILSVQLIKNVNRSLKTLIIGNANTIDELRKHYNIEIDFYSTTLTDEHLLKEIITHIKQKEQL